MLTCDILIASININQSEASKLKVRKNNIKFYNMIKNIIIIIFHFNHSIFKNSNR